MVNQLLQAAQADGAALLHGFNKASIHLIMNRYGVQLGSHFKGWSPGHICDRHCLEVLASNWKAIWLAYLLLAHDLLTLLPKLGELPAGAVDD
jgi:hypothetical protein